MIEKRNKFGGEIYWLLDSRFDFLLDSFMQEFGVGSEEITLVNSYHSKVRENWNKVYIPHEENKTVILMEPDEINFEFSKLLHLNKPMLVISFSGAGLPQNDNLISLIATGTTAVKCNDKWWQYCRFKDNQILTPWTYRYHSIESLSSCLDALLHRYSKVVVKKPRLSGGYQMAVLSSGKDLENYRKSLRERELEQAFLISEYIPHGQSFAGMGIVKKNGDVIFINIITEQILYREIIYEGLIFPAFLDDGYKGEIRHMTEVIGKVLGQSGYFGFYNVDFILGKDCKMYAIEINARLGFGTMLAACVYGDRFWKLLLGDCMCVDKIEHPKKRLVLGKIKAKEGRVYSNLESYSGITDWFQKQEGFFRTFFCGTEEPEKFEYGSYIGVFGEFFDNGDTREYILNMFWGRCIEYYKKEMVEF